MKKIITILCICLVLIGCSTVIDKPNVGGGGNSVSTTEQPKNTTDFSMLKYCAMGDSITYGWLGGVKMATPYPVKVGELLGTTRVINLGVPASSAAVGGVSPMVQRLDTIPLNSDIISIMCGANDFCEVSIALGDTNSTDITTFCGALNVMITTIKARCPNAYIFIMTTLPMRQHTVNSYGIDQDYANAVKQIAQNHNIDVLDTFTTSGFELVYNQSWCDGVHPNQDYITNNLAPQIAQFIRKNYNK